MPDEIEVPLEHAHDHIHETHKELHGEDAKTEDNPKKDKDSWTKFIAVVTALLAVVAAIGALRSGLLVNEALLAKNDEISRRTQATDQWNYYQAKSIKSAVYTAAAPLLPPGSSAVAQSRAAVERYEREQEDIKKKAEELEKEAEANDRASARDMDQHHIFAFSVSLCQIAIALSAVAALMRSRPIWIFGLAAGIAGTIALIGGFFGLHLPFAF